MNILISGIHGFIGSNFIGALKDKHTLYGLDIVFPVKDGIVNTFSWRDIEPTSFPFQALPQFDAIIHLAGKAHDTKNQSVAQSYFDINTGLIQEIFDFFLESSVKKFILFSSVKVTADSVVGDVFTGDVTPTPVGPHGGDKIKVEEYIKDHFVFPTASISEDRSLRLKRDKGRTTMNKQVCILRSCMIHGPGNRGNLNLLYNVAKKGIPWPLGDFDNRRSSTSIDNLCYMIEGLLNQDVPTGIYHIGDDEALSTNKLIGIMCEVMGKQPHIWKMNEGLMEGCAGLGTLLHLPLNTKRLRRLAENYVVSNAKVRAALGTDKLPVTVKEGLMKIIRSFEEAK